MARKPRVEFEAALYCGFAALKIMSYRTNWERLVQESRMELILSFIPFGNFALRYTWEI
jgi:hypothetical protein